MSRRGIIKHILSDGEWHRLEELILGIWDSVPPEIAARRALHDHCYPEKYTSSTLVSKGIRCVARDAISDLVRDGIKINRVYSQGRLVKVRREGLV